MNYEKWNLKRNNSHDRRKINWGRETHLLMIKVQSTKSKKGEDRRNNRLFKKLSVFISPFINYIWVLFSYPNFFCFPQLHKEEELYWLPFTALLIPKEVHPAQGSPLVGSFPWCYKSHSHVDQIRCPSQ